MSVIVGTNDGGAGSYGNTDRDVAEFVRTLNDNGYVVVRESDRPSWNHYGVGTGVGHDDAKFAESTSLTCDMRSWSSMAAYYENGGCWDGPWWTSENGVKYYGCDGRYIDSPYGTVASLTFARCQYLDYVGQSHSDCPYEYCNKR